MAWTKKDRVLAVLSGELPDRVPIFEYLIHDEMLERRTEGGKPIPPGGKEALVRACSGYLNICHPFSNEPYEPGEQVFPDGSKRVFERWTVWDIPPPGGAQETLIARVKEEIDRDEAYSPSAAEVAEWKRRAAQVNEWAAGMVYPHVGSGCEIFPGTMQQGIYLFADEPELVRRWSRARNRRQLAWMQAVADAADSPVMINWNDIAIKGGLIYPEHILEEFLYPWLAEVCDLIHSRGMKVLFHSDGDVRKAMDRLIECGIDGFNPVETTAGMQVEEFKRKYGKKVAIVGGMDAVDVLSFGTVDTVVRHAKLLVDTAGKNGGLIAASASGQIDNSMPARNVEAYFSTIWDYGRYI